VSAPELTFRELAQRLHLGVPALVEPPADLWSRIADAQRRRVQRARARRRAIWIAACGVVITGVAVSLALWFDRPEQVDWQARAQALELQLHALDASGAAHPLNVVIQAQSELALLDAALQAAYDEGADTAHLNALWKRRSELLGALLRARQQNMEISRI
jgi:hypothetical protein